VVRGNEYRDFNPVFTHPQAVPIGVWAGLMGGELEVMRSLSRVSGLCPAGLLGLTRSWAAELAPEKILVNAICPGWVDTGMAEEGLTAMAAASELAVDEIRKIEMSRVPLGKMSQPAEIAALVHFLLGGNQISITGQALDINGGAVMP
jgi:enoyl-[acyl-carrier-protein] reductase (NADH)